MLSSHLSNRKGKLFSWFPVSYFNLSLFLFWAEDLAQSGSISRGPCGSVTFRLAIQALPPSTWLRVSSPVPGHHLLTLPPFPDGIPAGPEWPSSRPQSSRGSCVPASLSCPPASTAGPHGGHAQPARHRSATEPLGLILPQNSIPVS